MYTLDEAVVKVFIYALCEPDTGSVRYVGKAEDTRRRLRNHLNDKATTRKAHWVRSLQQVGQEPKLVILEEATTSNWQEAERYWIQHYRALGCDLTNHTDGGEGLSNATEDTRAKLRAYRQADWADPGRRTQLLTVLHSPQRRAKISIALKGKPKTAEHVANLPQNKPGWHHTEEAKAHIAANCRGHRWTPDEIEVLRDENKGNTYGLGNKSHRGRTLTPEHRGRIGEHQRGRPKTPEHREKIRQAALRRWARYREEQGEKEHGSISAQSEQATSHAD